jgi:prolyl-tRNA editing enzyme YbaK/EbsC (Cys-tRNA(Pro) deacylase)
VTKARADDVRAATGMAIGGVAPYGHPEPLETLVDEDLLRYDVVWAAAGTPRHVFPIAPDDLVARTRGRIERVALNRAS